MGGWYKLLDKESLQNVLLIMMGETVMPHYQLDTFHFD